MKNLLRIPIFFCGFVLGCLATAQEVISSSGGSDNQVSYTLGQLVNATGETSNLIVTQGFHQSFSEEVEVPLASDLKLEMAVYPNPTSSMVTIDVQNNQDEISFKLFNLQGLEIQRGRFFKTKQLDLTAQTTGIYQLLLIDPQGRLLDTFKIQLK